MRLVFSATFIGDSTLKRFGNTPNSGPVDSSFPPKDARGKFPDQNQRGPANQDRTRLNERIRVPEVRLIDDLGNQLGVVSTREALAMAKEKGLDLVEVAPEARPPVCKILDYGKLKYTKKKKEQEAKKKAVTIDVKEIQLRPNIEDHDFMVKFRKMEEFLRRGDKVKIVIMFRGREMAYAKKQGTELANRLLDMAKDFSAPEAFPKLEGRRMIMVLGPSKGKSAPTVATAAPKKASEEKKAKAGAGDSSKDE